MPAVHFGPRSGPPATAALLALLGLTVGVSPLGWAAGLGAALLAAALIHAAIGADGGGRWGPADAVTLARLTLACGVAGLGATAPDGAARAALVALASAALALDAVDGQVARRTGTASAFGARFDGEADAFLILVLSIVVARTAGWWVLAIGAMRYAFLAAGLVAPWLRVPLPPRRWRKVVAAVQGIVLAAAAADVVGPGPTTAALIAALALLKESFGRDVVWLVRHRPSQAPATPLHDPRTAGAHP